MTTSIRSTSLQRVAIGIAGAALFLFLMLFRQPVFPPPWFDEGLNVSTSAMLAREGLYALPDSDGPRIFDAAIQTGPTVLLPVAVAFRVFGVELLQARLVMLSFAALALVAYALTARRLFGPAAAMLAVLLLLAGNREPFASFAFMGRQALGEVPALGLYLIGWLIWQRAVEQHGGRWLGLVLAGGAWGLAMLTKSQITLLSVACLGTLALLARYYYRQAGWLAFVLPGAIALGCVGLWFAAQLFIIGPEQFQRNVQVLREGFALHIVSLNPTHWRNALGVLWRSGWWWWGLPGLVWGIRQARHRTPNGFRYATALTLPIVSLIWFSGLSVGWSRYAFYTLVLSPIWTAALLLEVWHGRSIVGAWAGRRIAVAGLLALFVAVNSQPLIDNLSRPVDTGYFDMRAYLAAEVPRDAVIESWEWEISLDAPQPIHHPPTLLVNAYTEYLFGGRPLPEDEYNVRQAQPRYVLTGPFSAWVEIYANLLKDAEQVAAFGQYALYELRSE
jgi:hypothetical protein